MKTARLQSLLLPASDKGNERSVFNFIRSRAIYLKSLERTGYSEKYINLLNNLKRFRHNKDIDFAEINSDFLQRFEAYLQSRGCVRNTTSFYLRIFHTVYNTACDKGLIPKGLLFNPFHNVYTSIDKTVKRALPLSDIKRLKTIDLSSRPALAFARDMFLFSFCTRGMSFVDMAYLKKTDIQNGFLTYKRQKTKQTLTMEWTWQMQAIVSKYNNESTPYLLPIIISIDKDKRRQYLNKSISITKNLKKVAVLAGLTPTLTMYVARHSWATIAHNKNIPIFVISAALGHDSDVTTQIYLDSIQSSIIDDANKMILNDL